MNENGTFHVEELATRPLPARVAPEFRMVVRGYDREEVDAYIERLKAEIDDHRSPSGAVRRALEQVGDEVAGILQRAHETAAEVTSAARKESDDRLAAARREADDRTAEARAQADARLRDLDVDTDRIWAERDRIVQDARELARQLVELADAAAERFPPADAADDAEDLADTAMLERRPDPDATARLEIDARD